MHWEKYNCYFDTMCNGNENSNKQKKCTVNKKNEIRYCVNERKFSCIASVLFIAIPKIDFVRSFTHPNDTYWYIVHALTHFFPIQSCRRRHHHHHPIFALRFRYYSFVVASDANWSIYAWFWTKSGWPKCERREFIKMASPCN